MQERLGKRIVWRDDAAADAEVRAAVRALLQREIDADAAVQVALLNNPELQGTYADLGLAQADLVQAGLLRNPVFDAQVRFPSGGGRAALELAVSQDFLGILFRPLRKRVAAAAFAATKLRVAGKVFEVAGATRAAFYEVQAAEQVLELRVTVLQAAEASAELAERLRAAGNVRELDVATEQALRERARLDAAAAELDAIDAREQLTELMGLWSGDTPWTAAKRLPDPPAATLDIVSVQSRAIAASLALAVGREEIEQAAARLGLERIEQVFPAMDLGAAAERDIDGTWTVGPSATLTLPLFDQGQAVAARAVAELQRLQARHGARAVALRAAVRQAASRSLAYAQRAQHYRNVVIPLQTRVLDETLLQYNAMQVGTFQLLAARQQQADAGARYIEALEQYWLARADLEQLTAGAEPRGARRRVEPEERWPESTLIGAEIVK